MSIIFIATCSTFILFLFLLQWNFLNNLSYNLHEICSLPVNIGLLLIPVETIIGIGIWIRYRKEKNSSSIMNTILNLVSVILLCTCVFIYVIYINSVTSEGEVKDFNKFAINQGYYVKLGDNMIQISHEQYQKIKTGKWYHFKYEYNRLIPNKFTMVTFEIGT